MVSRIWTQDAATSPIVSGSSDTTSKSTLTLVPPEGSQALKVKCSVAMVWGDNATLDGAGTGKGYIPAVAEEWVVIPRSGRPSITVKTATGTGNFHFFFYSENL
jgi:hypothetical protein